MYSKIEKTYPPYTGSEPFVFLCFADEDAKEVEPLLERLYKRGCRVWYTTGGSDTVAQEKAAQSRMKEAGLVIAYCTKQFHDSNAKSRMMFLQSQQIPVITVDRISTDNLSLGLREGTPHISAYNGVNDEVEADIISTEGFSHIFLGDRPAYVKQRNSSVLKIIGAVIAVLIVASALFLAFVQLGYISPKQSNPDEIKSIVLDKLPSDITVLEDKYPQLEKIVISKSEAENSDIEQYLDKYTVVITEG